MAELFAGTVTLLFTDIEGSTQLLEGLGDAYADALAEHRRLVRESVAEHGGVELDTQGDALILGGAASTIWRETGAEIHVPFWNALLDRFLGLARESLSTEEAERAWETGRSLSCERAIEDALEPTTSLIEDRLP